MQINRPPFGYHFAATGSTCDRRLLCHCNCSEVSRPLCLYGHLVLNICAEYMLNIWIYICWIYAVEYMCIYINIWWCVQCWFRSFVFKVTFYSRPPSWLGLKITGPQLGTRSAPWISTLWSAKCGIKLNDYGNWHTRITLLYSRRDKFVSQRISFMFFYFMTEPKRTYFSISLYFFVQKFVNVLVSF